MVWQNLVDCLVALTILLFTQVTIARSEVPPDRGNVRPSLRAGYDLSQCASLLEECLRLESQQKSSCLYNTAKHVFCDGGQLGVLVYQRWSLTSQADSDASLNAASDPKLVDQQCLQQFDNQLLSQVIGKVLTQDKMEELSVALAKCALSGTDDLLRP